MRITFEEAQERYGTINLATKQWPDETHWMKVLTLPDDLVFPNWIIPVSQMPVKKVYINRDMAPSFLAVLHAVKDRGLEQELKTYDGIFDIRAVRGTHDTLSVHSYGLGIDLNAKENPLGGPGNMASDLVDCFLDSGFSWGGSFTRCDPMHFSWAWE